MLQMFDQLSECLKARWSDSCCLQQQEADEEEEEQEILALPAPGDDLSQEGQMEAEMHAAIASAELADYAQVG